MRTHPTTRARPCHFVVMTLLATACAKPMHGGDATDDSGSTSGAGSESTGAAGEPPPQPPGGGEGGGEDDGHGFIMEPDGGGAEMQCDLFMQDCPAGEKCNVWANDGGSAWNATKCVPIDADADEIGEPCTVVESGVSGLDSCVLGAICWNVDPETNTGTCVGFCTGSAADPMCEDPMTLCEGRDVPLCLPTCCPVEQTCPEGQGCYPVAEDFICAPDASGDQGDFRDPCEYINACDPGFFCANPDVVPGCEGSLGCCSALCYLGSQTCEALDPSMECTPWFAEGKAPPGYELVGACAIPQ